MQKFIIPLLLLTSVLFAEYNDNVVNYIFENRNIWQKYFQEENYDWMLFLRGRDYDKRNFWQRESLFTVNANLGSYYKHKERIIEEIKDNRKLTKEPAYFDVILPLIKKGELDMHFLYEVIPSDILVKNKEKIKDLLLYLINSPPSQWKNAKYNNSIRDVKINGDRIDIPEYDRIKSGRIKGYAELATLAQLDSIYNYKMVFIRNSCEEHILSRACKDMSSFRSDSLMTASRFLQIVDSCSNKKLRREAINCIERSTGNAIFHYVNKNYSKEKIIENFLENPSRNLYYIRMLADSSIISEIATYLCTIKKDKEWDIDFAYFKPIYDLLRSLYYDFDLKEKYFSVTMGYNVPRVNYRPQYHNNRPFQELYSENYMDFVKQYEAWIKKKFGKELKRKPQPSDITDNSPAITR
jgi:hypothetical protein